jgi:hypothetical protein
MQLPQPRLTLAALAVLLPAGGAAQPRPDSAPPALRVFLDCNAEACDFDHLRREIPWVSWVRDREDADLHLLITDQETGGGGQRVTLDYLGRGPLAETRKSLTYVSDPDDTEAEAREGLTRTLALGFVQFVDTTPLASQLAVVYRPAETPVLTRDEHDPWNLWVFEIGANGSLEGEAQQSRYGLEGSAEARRVADAFKIDIEVDVEYDHERFELDDTTTIRSTAEDYAVSLLTVWSLDDHWSAGGIARANRSTFLNRDLAVSGGPAIEYNVFPYRESTRRSLTLRYAIELAGFDYQARTVEGEQSQFLPRHVAAMEIAVQQPWGEIHGEVAATQYLHDLATHRIDTFLSFEYRLFRGLGLDLFFEFSRIKDQFYLAAESLSEEEVLLERRQRETDFQFDVGIGLTYRFGSAFANVVNPRF